MCLEKIQNKLKAPKNQFNAFGKYHYRSCEDILEALKPILADHNATLTISDSIENIGNRYYVKATATLGIKDKGTVSVTAYAREEEDKKGMDGSQITGAASSYARKYALNGLFLIDDTKDADTQDNTKETARKAPEPQKQEQPKPQTQQINSSMASENQIKAIHAILKGKAPDEDHILWVNDVLGLIGSEKELEHISIATITKDMAKKIFDAFKINGWMA